MTGYKKPVPQAIEVTHIADVGTARQSAKAMAQALGLDEREREEVAIAVSELASNLLKHAGHGRLALTPLREGKRPGIQIESVDNGPGIKHVEQAITDGFSAVGSLGCGLGAINRLMDELDITSPQHGGRGTRIVCRRWRSVNTPGVMPCPLDVGVATRPHPAMSVNGDAFVVQKSNESILVGVIDGLGHGQLAHQAAQAARLYVENHFDRPLNAIFLGVARACRGTHGVVMALARFDWARGRLTFGSVGNVECRVFGCSQPVNFIVRRGVIGLNAPNPVVTEHIWESSQVMVLHSDGLVTHWRSEDFPHLQEASATVAAQQLLHRLARDDDDATVVVVKGARTLQSRVKGK
jgi:anti-sigma regulatory factor (Ser/Thr protein kinase)/serine/threonine protein phosphatase PrpC